ncbi:MAG: protein tyrosine phosphatase [Actinomycetota bacterium]|nr:protein tyrosine phosphatase [Actinomycetota bacterium]
MHLLFVCTGNICRSPTAERLTLAYSEAERDALGGVLTARSAGTSAVVGRPMESSASLVLKGLGGTPDGFIARQLAEEDVHAADLVFTMTRSHRAAVLQMAPRMMSRTFTLREAAALLRAADGTLLAHEPDLDSRGRQLAATLTRLRAARIVQRDRQRDDITDPIGGDLEKFQRVGDAIAASLLPLLGALSANGVRHLEGGRSPAVSG